jgi:hypothetical protein
LTRRWSGDTVAGRCKAHARNSWFLELRLAHCVVGADQQLLEVSDSAIGKRDSRLIAVEQDVTECRAGVRNSDDAVWNALHAPHYHYATQLPGQTISLRPASPYEAEISGPHAAHS